MPQIFDETGRERVRILLLENGFDLIKTHGLKKTSISDVTKRAGIASGTF
ncbi:MAG: TetR family transcriptional regulator, partial [Lachnospiraceae bacterium]|nr:TetR family transcriptional regulator [Lachnospiraceae bacterium]